MAAPVYLGDEASAAGYRLAGARVEVPAAGAEGAALAAARAQAPLVLVSAAVAARIAERELRAALAALAPLTVIVPDLTGAAEVPDVAARMRHQLGLED
jgi:vacuolar-type H+-ATPase subunit F/Vma7